MLTRNLLAAFTALAIGSTPIGSKPATAEHLPLPGTQAVAVRKKIRTTCPSRAPSNARGNRSGKATVNTNCRKGTSGRT